MDDWLRDYESIDEYANELMHKLTQRNKYPTNTQPFAKSDLYIKDLFRKYQLKVLQLQETLNKLASLNRITQRESERRQRLMDQINDRCKQIEHLIQNPDSSQRGALFGNVHQKEVPSVGWGEGLVDVESGPSEPSAQVPFGQSTSQLRETRQLLMQEQDRGLDSLSTIITRQKYLAQGINQEIDIHNQILDNIGDAMEENDERLLRNTRNIRVVDKKTNTCGYWLLIIALLIAIIVVSVV